MEFAVTTDPLPSVPKWTKPRSLPPAVRTPTAPSAEAVGKGLTFPLLIVSRRWAGPRSTLTSSPRRPLARQAPRSFPTQTMYL